MKFSTREDIEAPIAYVFDLIALSQSRTRVMVTITVKAKTLTSRLLVQSLKLAKTKLTKRFKARVLDYAEDIEDRYRREG